MRTRSAFTVVSLLTTLSVASAQAQDQAEAPVSPADHASAVAEFGAGRALFEGGNCKGAIPHFVASLKREQSVGARFNLAECSEREGKTAAAWNHYKAAEQLAIRKGDNRRVELAHAAAADLDRKVTKARLVLPSDVPVTLTIDGTVVEAIDHWLLSTGYALEPSTPHTLAAATAGRPTWVRRDVHGGPGVELPAMVVDFGRKETVQLPERTPPLRTASYIVGGVGMAALATGGLFALLASSAKADAQSACTSGDGFTYPSTCNPTRKGDVDPANERAQRDATIATIAVVSGAVLLSTAAVLFYATRSKSTASGAAPTLRRLTGSGSGALLSARPPRWLQGAMVSTTEVRGGRVIGLGWGF
ncbi:hypothetical protein BH11MYX4_BH11MYX4_18960 [soil metagenome]